MLQPGIVRLASRWCTNRPQVVLLLLRVVTGEAGKVDAVSVRSPRRSTRVRSMPYKFNESRRHKIPSAKYRVTNWPEYDAALVKRGSLTVWMTEEAIAA